MLILGPAQHGYDFYHQPEWNYRSSPVTSMDLESSDRICSDLQHNRIRTIKYLEIMLLVALTVLIILSCMIIIYKYFHQCISIFPSFAARYPYDLVKNPSQPPTYTMVCHHTCCSLI